MALVTNAALTANGSIIGPFKIPTDKFSVVGFQYGAGTGTVQVQVSIDGLVWDAVLLTHVGTGATATDITAAGNYHADISGMAFVQMKKTSGVAACPCSLNITHNQ